MKSPSTLDHLLETLRQAGKTAELAALAEGSRVLLLPHGGRALGLFAPGDGENFYWTHPALESAESARSFYESTDWHNSGGDRTWLAPEVDIFFPQYPNLDLSLYFQPRQLDPGNYVLEQDGQNVQMSNRLTLRLSRTDREVELGIRKSYSAAPNPLRYEPEWRSLGGLQYAGYAQHTSLFLLRADHADEPAVSVGLWNLIQLPHDGDMLIPVYQKPAVKVLMGSVSDEDLVLSDRLATYRMRAPGEHKIGLRAVIATGRVGYRYASDGRHSLVVRNFFVNPSAEYVDVPWSEPKDLGYAIQLCNVNSALGSFSELEYHTPALTTSGEQRQYKDISQTWAFRGTQGQIDLIAKILLGAEQNA
jgi:hypothetical protein